MRPIIAIQPTGDPYGRGFEGAQSNDGGHSWFYRGDLGAMPRRLWRLEAHRINAILRYT